jgi:hypothetical protein
MAWGENLPAIEMPKYGPIGAPYAVPLSHDHKYLQNSAHQALDYWNLAPFYVSQFNEFACSVASVTMVLNGVTRAGRTLKAEETNVTQDKLLDKVKAVNWKERLMPGGLNAEKGLSLDQLETVVKEAFRQYDVPHYAIERVEVSNTDETTLLKFRNDLSVNEGNGNDYILIHYIQDVVTEAPGGPYPHISPIGAYDKTNKRVLVMDVDRDWYEPYWVSDERLLLAISKKTEKYGFGGYLWIRVK